MKQMVALLFLIIGSVFAVSDQFIFSLDTDKKELKNMAIYSDDGNIFIGSSNDHLTANVQDDGSIKLDDEEYIGIVKNYFKVENSTTEAAVQFSINGKGYLQYNGEKSFKAIPSGSGNIWILASKYATSDVSTAYDIKIKCLKSNGKKADKFNNFGSKASVQLAVLISCLLLSVSL